MGVFPTGPEVRTTYGDGSMAVERTPNSFDPGLANIARAQALMGGGGAIVGILAVLLPHPAEVDELGMVLVQASSIALGIWLWVSAGRVPLWALKAMPFIGTVSVSAVVYFSGDSTSAYALYYVWVAIYSFYLLSRREAALQITFAIANYAMISLFLGAPTGGPSNSEITHFAILSGTFLATALPLLYLRGRVEGLWSRLLDAASTDLDTGLPNRQGLHEALSKEVDRARMSASRVSVVVADLDRFRELEKHLGRKTADDVVKRIGVLLEDITRRIDTVGRTGPNQFTIILPETASDDSFLLAEQILTRIRRGFREEQMPLTASIGIASYPTDAATEEELMRLADHALRGAKMLGRDRAVMFSEELETILAGSEVRRDPQAHLVTMISLAEALDIRDGGTAEHCRIVGEYAAMIVRELGLSDQRLERVRLAGILHDIGKVGVPDAVLRKAGPLNDEERAELQKHPEIAARILGTRELVDIRAWVLATHERPDGQGYPRGLKGDQIPLESRILAVADAYEAMTSARSHRPSLDPVAARAELIRHAGSQFDPEVVEAFLLALDRREHAVRDSDDRRGS